MALIYNKKSNDRGEILIYGDIGFSWWDDGVTAKAVKTALDEIGGDSALDIRVNSYGGDVFEGIAIHSLFSAHGGRKTMHIDGIAASAASVIAMAGDVIRIAQAGQLMIHDAWTIEAGNGEVMRRTADRLDMTSQSLAQTYAKRTGKSETEMRDLMRADGGEGTWFTSQAALDIGLVDEIAENVRVDGSAKNIRDAAHSNDPAVLALPEFKARLHGFTRVPSELSAESVEARRAITRMQARLVSAGRG